MTVLLAYLGQMILNPVISPLSRAMGMAEWQIGATISLAAMALVVFSQFWGRRSQRLGVKRTLFTAMTIALVALAGFAVVSWLGTAGLLAGPLLVVLVMATRGVVYGSAISAVSPSAQSYLVTHSVTEEQRVRAVGAVGAMNGFSGILGSVLGGALSAIGGLMLPITLMPVAILVGIVLLGLRFRPERSTGLVEKPASISFRDPRVAPFLVAGFLMFLAFSSVQSVIGFAVQDRFGLGPEATAAVTAVMTVIIALTMAVTQSAGVARLHWDSRRLLRSGLLVAAVGGVLMLPFGSPVIMGVGGALLGIGVGMAMPGYTAGPTMSMTVEEQGGLAGLINANNGLTYAIAPVLSTSLYGANHTVPFIGLVVLLAGGTVFCHLHPNLRRG
ncbi:MFS transporter [uncultured Propionibacterium sp.]|uniref:MFS transporter n=1 Tax=uncultured Propionibacterium sp. TaxID=218066 RepID=UPI00292D8E4C|nr:MFS transporter [uncultured Propionibacterium sp.]